MTLITIDTETQSLDANRFLMGSLCTEDFKTESFNSKGAMWRRLMEIAQKHKERKKCVIFYAHNMRYDYYAIRPNPEPREAKHYSDDPFIVDFEDEDGRIFAKFTSTTSLWRGTLKSLGEAIGHAKGETPEWLKQDEYEPSMQELAEAAEYNRQDVKVLMHYLLELKAKLGAVGMRPRWVLTAAQVSISHLLNEAVREDPSNEFFKDKQLKVLWPTRFPRSLWAACRGGRTQVFYTERTGGVRAVDINSAYPYHLATMRMPNLKSEECYEQPLEHGWNEDELLAKIGVSCVVVTTAENRYGVLPVRPDADYSYWPRRSGQVLQGVWTHQELRAAKQRGFVINSIDWSITYQETHNPFVKTIVKLYKMKQDAANPSDKAFAKMLLNAGIGKFSQIREQSEYEWDDVWAHTYRQKGGWTAVDQDGDKRLYKRRSGTNYPRWYAPIINALVRADAQLRLLEDMESLPPGSVLYTDTDSLFYKPLGVSGDERKERIKYSSLLGDYKLIGDNLTLTAWGKKAYRLGDELKLSGAGNIVQTDLARGTVTARRMLTDHETADKAKAGTFITIEHDLSTLQAEQAAKEREYETLGFIVDDRLLQLADEHQGEHPSCVPSTQPQPSF